MTPGAGRDPGHTFLSLLRAGLEQCRVTGKSRLLVAISGGTDSTALLLGLHELAAQAGFEIEAAHFNHALRGDASVADEQFCRDLCERLGIRLHVDGRDVRAHASDLGLSVEAAARDLRYRFLARVVSERGLDGVTTAHTMDDQAETVLLALTRGAGLRGAAGMAYVTKREDLAVDGTPLVVMRPMLKHNRSHNAAFCEVRGVQPQVDESNSDIAYARNRIRLNVVPELEKVNSDVINALSRFAGVAAADAALIEAVAMEKLDQAVVDEHGRLSRPVLLALLPGLLPHVLRVAYERAAHTAVDLDFVVLASMVDAVRSGSTGSLDLPNGARLLVDHDTVMFVGNEGEQGCPYPERVGEQPLLAGEPLRFEGGGEMTLRRVSPVPDLNELPRWQALVAASVADGPLAVRSRSNGDRFQPLGMAVEMKLQDFFVNRGVPTRWRDRVPLVMSAQGICWVVGERIAEWARVPEGAEEAVLLEYVPPESSR